MPPKKKLGKAAKKGEAKRQSKVIEDKTFGLKNKKKSKKVQQYVQRVTKQVQQSGKQRGMKTPEEKEAEKKAAKLAQAQEEKELRELFASSLDGGLVGAPKTGRRKKSANRRAEAKALEEQKKKEEEDAALAVDPYAGMSLVDRIEAMRNDLSARGVEGTPVTAESFQKWKADRAAAAKAEADDRVAEELKKGARGKGLSVLTGRELFEYNAGLFRDDDKATGADEMVIQGDAPDSDEDDEGDDDAMRTSDDDEADGEGGGRREDHSDDDDGGAQAKSSAATAANGDEGGEAPAADTKVDVALFAEDDEDLDDLDDLADDDEDDADDEEDEDEE